MTIENLNINGHEGDQIDVDVLTQNTVFRKSIKLDNNTADKIYAVGLSDYNLQSGDQNDSQHYRWLSWDTGNKDQINYLNYITDGTINGYELALRTSLDITTNTKPILGDSQHQRYVDKIIIRDGNNKLKSLYSWNNVNEIGRTISYDQSYNSELSLISSNTNHDTKYEFDNTSVWNQNSSWTANGGSSGLLNISIGYSSTRNNLDDSGNNNRNRIINLVKNKNAIFTTDLQSKIQRTEIVYTQNIKDMNNTNNAQLAKQQAEIRSQLLKLAVEFAFITFVFFLLDLVSGGVTTASHAIATAAILGRYALIVSRVSSLILSFAGTYLLTFGLGLATSALIGENIFDIGKIQQIAIDSIMPAIMFGILTYGKFLSNVYESSKMAGNLAKAVGEISEVAKYEKRTMGGVRLLDTAVEELRTMREFVNFANKHQTALKVSEFLKSASTVERYANQFLINYMNVIKFYSSIQMQGFLGGILANEGPAYIGELLYSGLMANSLAKGSMLFGASKPTSLKIFLASLIILGVVTTSQTWSSNNSLKYNTFDILRFISLNIGNSQNENVRQFGPIIGSISLLADADYLYYRTGMGNKLMPNLPFLPNLRHEMRDFFTQGSSMSDFDSYLAEYGFKYSGKLIPDYYQLYYYDGSTSTDDFMAGRFYLQII
jgi:hypothetical protein